MDFVAVLVYACERINMLELINGYQLLSRRLCWGPVRVR